MPGKPQIAKLATAHNATAFHCGNEALNRFIKLHALQGQRAGVSQSYAAVIGDVIVGYHTLVVGSIVHDDAPERVKKDTPRHPVPVIILARLAVDIQWHGRGLGAAIVADAMRRILQAADIGGVRAMLVHAKDEAARNFYLHLGFESFGASSLTLYRLLNDIRAMAAKKAD